MGSLFLRSMVFPPLRIKDRPGPGADAADAPCPRARVKFYSGLDPPFITPSEERKEEWN